MSQNKNWWFDEGGKNTLLAGYLPDTTIAEFVRTNDTARADFQAAFDLLDAERQAYLTDLVSHNIRAFSREISDQTASDAAQKRMNRAGVRVRVKGRLV